jgi:hypothetical protein
MSVFYLIFIALSAYFSFRYDGIEEYNSHKQHRLWLMCIYLICLTGFSYGLGADKFTYMDEFEEYPNTFDEIGDIIFQQIVFKGEMPLWTILNLACKSWFNSFYAVQLLESATINIAVCYLASKYTHRYFLFLLVYFFSLQYFIFNTEVMREGFALGIMLLGMDAYVCGEKWKFFLALPLALLFHISAAVVLLFLFARFRITWKTLIYAFFASFLIWFLSDHVLGKFMVLALGGMGAFVGKALYYAIQATTIFGFLRWALIYLVFPFIIMYTSTKLEPSEELKKRKEKFIAFMLILGVIASAMSGFIRLYNYTYIFYLIMFADFIYMLIRYKEHLIVRLGTFAGTLFFISQLYFGHYNTTDTYFYQFFYPYTCILDEDADVFFRPIAHNEATELKMEDNNTRDIE